MSRTIAGSFKAVSCLLAGAAALGLAGGAAAAPGAEVTGAVTMFIKYRTEPWTRPAFRKHLAGSAVPQFAKWKEEGVLKDYLLLYNLYLNLDVWDAMAVIDFGDTAQVQKWKEVERRSPGGLSPEGLTLGWPTSTQWADRTWFGSQETGDRAKAYYIVIEYDYFEPEAFRAFGKVFLDEQVNRWMTSGALNRYDVWLNQFPNLRPCETPNRACASQSNAWDCLMIWEYKDLDALAWRDVTKWKTRGELKDPAFNVVVQQPRSFRIDYNTVVARAIVPVSE